MYTYLAHCFTQWWNDELLFTDWLNLCRPESVPIGRSRTASGLVVLLRSPLILSIFCSFL